MNTILRVSVVLLVVCFALALQAQTAASEANAPLISAPGLTVEAPPAVEPPAADDRVNPERASEYFPPMLITPSVGPLKPRQVCEKDFYLNIVDVSNTDRLVIKFTEESRIRWSKDGPYSKAGLSVSALSNLLAEYPQYELHRQTPQLSEELFDYWELNGERNTGQDLANLNNYYVWETRGHSDPMGLIRKVIALDIVETAFYEPKAAPACTDIAPATPNWVANQDYLEAAPTGVDANYAGTYHPSGRGNSSAWCIDIEWDWTEDHEDFPATFSVLHGGDQGATADHGDACVSIVGACNNSYGVTGISYNVSPKAISHPMQGGWVPAFNLASNDLFAGESYWIEIHALGPDPGYSCDAGCGNCSQFRYVCVEYWQDVFDAISTHTANGRLVYEAAGNGQMDLDNAVYANRFQRWFRDSGAILCGAGIPGTRAAECWSNYGSRLDLQGWGSAIYAAGYGYLYNPTGNRNQMYTASFGGTSGATPIVTGSGNCLQGISQDKYGITLTPTQMRNYLSATGTAWTGSRDVGERPNLATAINYIEPDVVPWIRGGWTYSCVPLNSASGTDAACALPGILLGNSNTYFNVSGRNTGLSPAPDAGTDGVYGRVYVDGDWIYWVSWTPRINSSDFFYHNNYGPVTIRGGRHTTQWTIDPLDAFSESNENNNWINRQFVWSPWQLTMGAGLERTAPPLKSWGSPSYYNGDGFRANPSQYWLGVAVLPQSTNDVDLFSYADSYSSTSGFDTYQITSARGSGSSDLILVNGNTVGYNPSRLFQAIRYSDASTSDYRIEADSSTSASWYPPYQTTVYLASNEILDIYEVWLSAGTQYFMGVKDVSSGIDLNLLVYGHTGDYYSYYGYDWISASQGVGGNESFLITPDSSGWYAAVVLKDGSESYGIGGWYTFVFELPGLPDLTQSGLKAGWDEVIVPRNAADAFTSYCPLPAAIQGNTTSYVNAAWYNAGTGVAPSGYTNELLLDNTPLGSWAATLSLNPWNYDQKVNSYPTTITGGRHTFTLNLDTGSDVTETSEANNWVTRQYVWSPLNLASDAGYVRDAPTDRGTGAYPNSDGFQFDMPSNVSSGFVMLPTSTTADYDVALYSDYSGTTTGFSNYIVGSGYIDGYPDYVIVPFRQYFTQTSWFPAVYEYDGSNDAMQVEFDHTINGGILGAIPWALGDPDTIDMTGIWNLYEIYLSAGTTVRIACDIIAGTADVELRLHRDSLEYQARSMALAFADAGGGDEDLIYTPTVSDWYILVVCKNFATESNLDVVYDLSTGGAFDDPLPVENLSADWWSSPVGIRLSWTHVNYDLEGDPLPNRRYVVYRNANVHFIPTPADSIGGTADSIYIDPNPFSSATNFYRVKVKTD